MKNPKLNPKKEFHDVMEMINRKFMLERCKLYKVRHRKNEDTLLTLCYKYLYKLEKMKPWDIPDYSDGNAGWVNPDRMLEDEAIRLKLARLTDHPRQNEFEKRVKKLIGKFIEEVEFIENVEWIKKDMSEAKKLKK